MGYYSTMNIYSFHVEDIEKTKELFEKYKKNDPEGYFFYNLKILSPEAKQVTVVPEDGEYTAKHYGNQRLAYVISKIIAPGETTELTFEGEDNIGWGYKISRDKIEELDKEYLNNEEYLLINNYRENKFKGLKFILEKCLNNICYDAYDFVEGLDDLHPTLQQKLMRFFIAWCHKLAQQPTHDLRNEASIELAKEIVAISKDHYLPHI